MLGVPRQLFGVSSAFCKKFSRSSASCSEKTLSDGMRGSGGVLCVEPYMISGKLKDHML